MKFSYSFPILSKLEYKRKSLGTRELVLIVTYLLHSLSIFLKRPYIHERGIFIWILSQSLMIEGGKYLDSLEKLFTLQNIEELKIIIRQQVFSLDLGFTISRDLTKPGPSLFFWIHASLCVCKCSL